MKKTYIIPSIGVLPVAVEKPVAESFLLNNSDGKKITNSNEILSRDRGTRNSNDDFDDLW